MAASTELPTSVRIRKIEPWVIKTHAGIAKNSGISLEEHFRRVLKEQALSPQEEFAKEMQQHRAAIAEKFGTNFPNSEELIRAEREESC